MAIQRLLLQEESTAERFVAGSTVRAATLIVGSERLREKAASAETTGRRPTRRSTKSPSSGMRRTWLISSPFSSAPDGLDVPRGAHRRNDPWSNTNIA
jgi:hypothetical protein